MIDHTLLRKNPETIKKSLIHRIDAKIIDKAISSDKAYRKAKTTLDDLLAQKNISSKSAPKNPNWEVLRHIKQQIKSLEDQTKNLQQQLTDALHVLPNIPEAQTPIGSKEKDNKILREVGKIPHFKFHPKDYLSLVGADKYFLLSKSQKVSGSRFSYLAERTAFLELALMHFTVKHLQQEGFTFMFTPTMIRTSVMKAMGYMDQVGEGEIFHLRDDDLVLIGTSEQSLGPMHMDEQIDAENLPLRYCAFSTCYRREAGSYGKDTKGILRLHQFDKIEMFSFCHPDESAKEHAYLLSVQESLVKSLKIPYRVIDLCAGQLGQPSARTFDIECFLPGQNNGQGQYRETHSSSNCTDFQSRSLKIKLAGLKHSEKQFVHTLNATGCAMQRMIIAIMENYQQSDGSFKIPKILRPYMLSE